MSEAEWCPDPQEPASPGTPGSPLLPPVQQAFNQSTLCARGWQPIMLTGFLRNFLTDQWSNPVNIFNPQFVSDMESNPEFHVNQILKENDTYNWAPRAPTRLYYCSGDEVVPHENSLVADSVMNENRAPDIMGVDLGADLGHSACARPALLASIDFFNS